MRPTLTKFDGFDLYNFLANKPLEERYKSLDLCSLLILEYKDFLSVIQNNDKDFEEYQMVKHKIQLEQKDLDFLVCEGCL